MRVAEAWRVAIDALRANRLRSILTMLGVVIGVGAVVALVSIGTGTKRQIEQQVEGLGSNLLIVVPGRLDPGAAPTVSTLTMDDVDAVTRVVGDRSRVAVTTQPWSRRCDSSRWQCAFTSPGSRTPGPRSTTCPRGASTARPTHVISPRSSTLMAPSRTGGALTGATHPAV